MLKLNLSRRSLHRVVSPLTRPKLSIRLLRRAFRAFWRVLSPPPLPF